MALNRNKAFYLVGNAEWTLGDQSWLINTLENHLRGSNNVITYSKSRYGKGRTVDRVRRTRPVKGNKHHWNKIIKKIIPKEVAKKCWDGQDVPSGPSLRYGPSGDSVRTSPLPKNQKDSAEGLLIFFKREDVFIYNGNTIEYHVCGPRWKNYTWKIDLNKT